MGGPGSGGRYWHWWRSAKKTTVEQCLSLDANRWSREGVLRAGVFQSGTCRWTYPDGGSFAVNYAVDTTPGGQGPCVRLWYSWLWGQAGQPESASYTVELSTTRPRLGGLRWWFLCPLITRGQPCGRRVAKLHLPPRGRHFGCRGCHGLTYASCQESRKSDPLARLLATNMGEDYDLVRRAMRRLGKRR